MLKRGLREGCASSCTLYNVFHNCALEELNRVTPGIRLRCSCEKVPWTECAKGVRWRADLRNKRFTAEEMGTWLHRCAHCEVSFPCRSGLTRHANECRKRRAREGLSV